MRPPETSCEYVLRKPFYTRHTDDGQDIPGSLRAVGVDTLNGCSIGILSLERVLENSEEHVDEVDEA